MFWLASMWLCCKIFKFMRMQVALNFETLEINLQIPCYSMGRCTSGLKVNIITTKLYYKIMHFGPAWNSNTKLSIVSDLITCNSYPLRGELLAWDDISSSVNVSWHHYRWQDPRFLKHFILVILMVIWKLEASPGEEERGCTLQCLYPG